MWTIAILLGAAVDSAVGGGPRPELLLFLAGGAAPVAAHIVGRSFAADDVLRVTVLLVWTSVAVSACLLAGSEGAALAALFITPPAAAAACGPRRALSEGVFVAAAGLIGVAAVSVSGLAPADGAGGRLGLLPWAGALAAIAFAAAASGAAARR
ncbi:MAG: hypothetical protein MI723_19630, partial [Caulobacterales bacterium]|nr:hypothetical protein [Caulobacterales bacterium]